jgi:hypothetical protein
VSTGGGKRHVDTFWDSVIRAHDTVTVYPEQTIDIENNGIHAQVRWMPENKMVSILTWTHTDNPFEAPIEDENTSEDV